MHFNYKLFQRNMLNKRMKTNNKQNISTQNTLDTTNKNQKQAYLTPQIKVEPLKKAIQSGIQGMDESNNENPGPLDS